MNSIKELWTGSSMINGSSSVIKDAHKILKSKLSKLLDRNGYEMIQEFSQLHYLEEHKSTDASYKFTNKNRYHNILPFDFNRIQLNKDTSEKGYINASLLCNKEDENLSWKYIATQGPLHNTIQDFWEMVIQEQVKDIVMLTRCIEGHMEKCAHYFPIKKNEMKIYGRFNVTVIDVNDDNIDITIRYLQIIDNNAMIKYEVAHYHYHEWPDHGIPEYTRPIRDLINAINKRHINDSLSSKTVVHCSAGVGRTGSYCVIDIIFKRLRSLCEEKKDNDISSILWALNIPEVLIELRKQRLGMVQTKDQYYFCYQVVMHELEAITSADGHF